MKKVLLGDGKAYAELVRTHHPRVIAMCHGMLGNETEAQDAAQDVFIRAYKALKYFRGESKFSTWLYRIAYRHCIDLIRMRKRQKTDSLEALIDQKGDQINHIISRPRKKKMSIEDKDLISRVLSTMIPDYRQILVLRETQGLTYEEISQTLKVSIDSVKAKLRRARQDLQKKCQLFLPETTNRQPEVTYEHR